MNTLYPHLLGDAFRQLAPLLQRFHTAQALPWHGEARVIWSRHPAVRLLLKLVGLPREAGSLPITVCVTGMDDSEKWQRQFGPQAMISRQTRHKDSILESFGPVTLHLDTLVDQGALVQTCPHSRLLGIPLPRPLQFRVTAREWQQEERFHFDVEITWANVSLIRYTGWLRPQTEMTPGTQVNTVFKPG